MDCLRGLLKKSIEDGRRGLFGFDFAFGYPADAAQLVSGRTSWRSLWRTLADAIIDQDDNQSNRFEVAAQFNGLAFPEPLYWGRPRTRAFDGLPARKPASDFFKSIERRRVEHLQKSAKSVWQLAYSGAVGSQALLGIARLHGILQDPAYGDAIAVWPFDEGFAPPKNRQHVFTEIYPSIFPLSPRPGEIKDSAQVRAVATAVARADAAGSLAFWFEQPRLESSALSLITDEEGWIFGVGLDHS